MTKPIQRKYRYELVITLTKDENHDEYPTHEQMRAHIEESIAFYGYMIAPSIVTGKHRDWETS